MFNCNMGLVMKDYVNVKTKYKTIRKRLSENHEAVKCAIAFAVLVVLLVIIFST